MWGEQKSLRALPPNAPRWLRAWVLTRLYLYVDTTIAQLPTVRTREGFHKLRK